MGGVSPGSGHESTIEWELGWAAGLGFNVVHVYLHDLLWKQDREGSLQRLGRFLAAADQSERTVPR